MPPKSFKVIDEDKKNKTENSAKGPQKKRYNPNEGLERRFKGGEKLGNENICKKRYQQISITALGDLNLTNSARILQTASQYTMTLQVGTTDFSSSGVFKKLGGLAFAILAMMFLSF